MKQAGSLNTFIPSLAVISLGANSSEKRFLWPKVVKWGGVKEIEQKPNEKPAAFRSAWRQGRQQQQGGTTDGDTVHRVCIMSTW